MEVIVSFIRIFVYSLIAMLFLTPCWNTIGLELCTSIAVIIGFTWGLLNEILNELKKKKE